MDELPFRLKGWSYKEFLEEIEQVDIPSDQESTLAEDYEEPELLQQTLQDEILLSEDSDKPNDDEDDISLSILRQQIIRDRPGVQEFRPPV
ncbi:unnamed protein product [Acanthoscelides obtectus]|uniref:Uncharacterized protein n=1 Tax=Acanthoscelides obtectus TaxID=200917 RepID=A0A9P0P1H2_ACAOB|nr:unnamed protein product [Acanthoscelides obtectus]CAK1632600.1 hypothetical protein AOBTE_LOCUS7642 [Acanthoscelides obtectus]